MNNNLREIKRAVITGGTGAIGTALIEELIRNNIEVLVLCRKGSLRNQNIPEHSLVTKRFCDLNQLESFEFGETKEYDAFFHLAWAGTFGESRNDMFLQNLNVKYSLHAVALAKKLGCKIFFGAGSQAEYGRVNEKLNDNTKTNPETGYGIAKLCAGQMTRQYANQLGIEHIWVRILSVFGPNDGKNTMVMSTINKISNNESPKTTRGEQIWDYLYSEDAARAFVLLALNGKNNKTYVLGRGEEHMLSEYIKKIRDLVNPSVKIDFGAIPYSKNQVMYLCADISELTKDTGWTPLVDFESGVKKILSKEKNTLQN